MKREIGTRVKIVYPSWQTDSLSKAFNGKIGEIVNYEEKMYRVRLDRPVTIDGIGRVEDDLWESSYLKTLRNQ